MSEPVPAGYIEGDHQWFGEVSGPLLACGHGVRTTRAWEGWVSVKETERGPGSGVRV